MPSTCVPIPHEPSVLIFIYRLSHGLDSTACMHLSREIWIQVCQFFHHDVNKRQPEYLVDIQGFGRKLLPVQALTVWHALQMFHGPARAVFVGHIMGIGKTTIAFAIHYVQHQINKIHHHIQTSPEKHAQPTEHDPDPACPSKQAIFLQYGFDCPCCATSPTYFVRPRLGVTVALAPLGLLDTWLYEGLQCFPRKPDGQPHEIEVLKAHGSTVITPDLRRRLVGKERLFVQSDTDLPAASEYHPRLANGSVFVVSTSHSLENRFLNVFRDRKTWTSQPEGVLKSRRNGTQYMSTPRPITKYTPYYRTTAISTVIRDECHLERTENAASIRVIRIIIEGQPSRIRLMPMSGTALTFGPLDIARYVQLAAQPSWDRDPILKHWRQNECAALGKRWETVCTTQGNMLELEQIIARFQPLVERLFIRFTNQSDFLGHKPVKVPRNELITISCDNGVEWTLRVERLREEEEALLLQREQKRRAQYRKENRGSETGYEPLKRHTASSYYRARLCASLPFLMDLGENGVPYKLTEGEWKAHQNQKSLDMTYWEPETPADPYFANLQAIVNSSGKLKEIGQIIKQLEHVKDAEGKPCRQIWCSYFFTGAYVMYLVRLHSFSRYCIFLLTVVSVDGIYSQDSQG
jgi:hypothetical protein